MFKVLEGENAVLRVGGVYKEAKLAVRNDGELFASYGSGWVRLYADGKTSAGAKTALDALALDAPLHKDRFGRLCVTSGEGRKALPPAESDKLLALEDKA